MEDTATRKSQLRHLLQSQRDSISATERALRSTQACQHLLAHPDVRNANCTTIGLYAPRSSELDVLPAFVALRALGRACVFPRVAGSGLEFAPCDDPERMQQGRFGVREPEGPAVSLGSVPLMVIPGLGFDREGNRLGYGKGFYDRALCDYTGVCVGVAFSACMVQQVPSEAHDRRMDWLVTEQGTQRGRV